MNPLHRRQWLGQGLAAVLAAGAAPAFVRHARAADVPRFPLGVASGQPRPDRLVLWTRLMGIDLPPTVPVQWQLAHDEGFQQIAAQGSETALSAWAHSVHAEPQGLAPGRWYFYRFAALGQTSPVGRTRTAPSPDAPTTLRAALASCQRWEHGHYAAWAHVASQPHDLVLFVGDYIYEYASTANRVREHSLPYARTLAGYREHHALYKSDPLLQDAHAACPWVMVWDDHEVENDYADGQSPKLSGAAFLALRAAAYQAYWEHMPVPADWRPRGPDMRVYERFAWGRLAQIHGLDARQYRAPQACPRAVSAAGANIVAPDDCPTLADTSRSMLGTTQERWLADGWDLERPWNIVAQQTLMARATRSPITGPGTGRYWMDGWDGYPHARQRLLTSAAERQVANLVVLGGDVHAHYVADLKADYDDARAPIIGSEFCGTSISSNGPPPGQASRLATLNPHLHHARSDQRGYVSLHLDERHLRAELMAVDRVADVFSTCSVQAEFVVEAGRPGPQRV